MKKTKREKTPLRIKNELHEGPNPLWLTIFVLANIGVFVGFGYLMWEGFWPSDE
jgi:hypothetical protein